MKEVEGMNGKMKGKKKKERKKRKSKEKKKEIDAVKELMAEKTE